MDPLWIIPFVGFFVALFAGIVVLLDNLSRKNRKIPHLKKA